MRFIIAHVEKSYTCALSACQGTTVHALKAHVEDIPMYMRLKRMYRIYHYTRFKRMYRHVKVNFFLISYSLHLPSIFAIYTVPVVTKNSYSK